MIPQSMRQFIDEVDYALLASVSADGKPHLSAGYGLQVVERRGAKGKAGGDVFGLTAERDVSRNRLKSHPERPRNTRLLLTSAQSLAYDE